MREIAPDLLWVGNASDARDLALVLQNRIEAVVDLAMEELPAVLSRELIYCRFPLVDGQGNSPAVVGAAVNTAVTLLTAKIPTLISCGGGMSRSPAIAAAVIARLQHIAPDEALTQVAATGPHDVTPLLWQEVTEVLSRMVGLHSPTRSAGEEG
jgi:protein-tyrosine phosphatase